MELHRISSVSCCDVCVITMTCSCVDLVDNVCMTQLYGFVMGEVDIRHVI